ncbi:NAD-dependent succinate-semialdehyde dehydrogenase [Erwinia sp. HR93]|uniref:NAD-dependent succinate-semialdehyde dehydrogenase n=1 Tax=Erwinia sp. HR93 TaxID=3094840 RepID=UPI002ADECEA4|nr:NAD-dependent succinate-semialdehyde dehydrogenase [Erwinia sp. HR93]MEA1064369.1 NAD-dependent succinate-semialdehyde dehydrogenase [Erwinia sp. HR93]
MSYQTINPFTNQLIKEYPSHTVEDIESAITKANDLYHSHWSRGDITQRLPALNNFADLLEQRADSLARLISEEMGKLIEQSRGEILLCAKIARYYAENAQRLLAPQAYDSELGEAWVEHHPIGILMAVEPWNFPFYQLMRVFAPALAVGNPVIVKHAGIVPRCAETFEKLALEAGAPQGAYTNLFISTEQVANIIADPRIQGVALTGSENAGSAVAAQAGKMLKKSTLELGGNDVFIVLDDCDLEDAVKVGAQARLNNAGQVCTAAKRFIVQKSIADSFIKKLTQRFSEVKIGDPLDESTTLGPLSSRGAVQKLQKQVDAAIQHGARVLYGGKAIQHEGNFFEATILTEITRDNPAWFEEFFGPVAQIYIVENDDQAIALANDSHYGLGGAIFSQNIDRAKRLASSIETGMVYINSLTDTTPELPFGGVKRSGYGRELADIGIKEFTNHKLIVVSK